MKASTLSPRARTLAGFTLIEILVAMFVFAIVLASLFGTWRVIARSTETAIRVASESQRTRLGLESLENSLSAAQIFQANAPLYAFQADTAGDFAELSFVATLPDSFPGSGFFQDQRLRRLTLLVEPSAQGGKDLVLHQIPLLAPTNREVETYPLVLVHDINLFQLEFWDKQKNEFVEEWLRTNQLPMAVRVTLAMGGGGSGSRSAGQIVTRTIRLPDNVVGADMQGGGAAPPGANVR